MTEDVASVPFPGVRLRKVEHSSLERVSTGSPRNESSGWLGSGNGIKRKDLRSTKFDGTITKELRNFIKGISPKEKKVEKKLENSNEKPEKSEKQNFDGPVKLGMNILGRRSVTGSQELLDVQGVQAHSVDDAISIHTRLTKQQQRRSSSFIITPTRASKDGESSQSTLEDTTLADQKEQLQREKKLMERKKLEEEKRKEQEKKRLYFESLSPEEKIVYRRKEAVRELVETETDYVEDLETIIEVYINPLKQKNIIPDSTVKTIFSNLTMIAKLHAEFEKILKDTSELPEDKQNFGETFLNNAAYLKIYCVYSREQDRSLQTIRELKGNPEFSQFLDEGQRNPLCKSTNLLGFLIKPIQRICKYPLLLKEIQRYTKDDHLDYGKLTAATAKVEEVVTEVNDSKRQIENVLKISEIQTSIEGAEELHILTPARKFVREGMLYLVQNNKLRETYLFLFNDLLVCVKTQPKKKPYLYVDSLSLENFNVRDAPDAEGLKFIFTVSKNEESRSKLLTFCAKTLEEKQDWIGSLNNCITAKLSPLPRDEAKIKTNMLTLHKPSSSGKSPREEQHSSLPSPRVSPRSSNSPGFMIGHNRSKSPHKTLPPDAKSMNATQLEARLRSGMTTFPFRHVNILSTLSASENMASVSRTDVNKGKISPTKNETTNANQALGEPAHSTSSPQLNPQNNSSPVLPVAASRLLTSDSSATLPPATKEENKPSPLYRTNSLVSKFKARNSPRPQPNNDDVLVVPREAQLQALKEQSYSNRISSCGTSGAQIETPSKTLRSKKLT